MTKLYSISCPNCNTATPLATKNKEALTEMAIECNKCAWKGLAQEGIINEKSFEEWF